MKGLLIVFFTILGGLGYWIYLEDRIIANEQRYMAGLKWYDSGTGFKMLAQKKYHPDEWTIKNATNTADSIVPETVYFEVVPDRDTRP